MVNLNLGHVKGNGITSIEKTGTSGLVDTYTVTYDNGDTDTFEVTNGEDGSEVSITQVLSSGTKLATITIDGTSTDLYCSSGGSADIVTSWESTLSDTKVPSEKLTKDTLDTKVDKEIGKGLSTNDYTTTEKDKLAGIEAQANKTIVDSSLSSSSENPVQNKVINTALTNKLEETDLTAFCNTVREAYTTYIITLDSATITTKISPTTITAILTGNGVPVANKTIELYDGSTLVDSEVTDVDGEVNFSVDLTVGTTVYTLKYGSATADCTVIYDPNTFPLDGTDTIIGNASSENGELRFGYGASYLTDYYLDNTGLWEASLEYYQTLANWSIVLVIVGQESNKYGFTYKYNGQLNLGRINGGNSGYDLGADFVFKIGEWTKVTFKKISTDQLTITVGEHSTTITNNKIPVPSAFYLMVSSSQGENKKIRNIRFNPATPNI